MIGRGYHKKSGEAHAEVNAIKNSTENVAGATLYCNLEPCCHTNKKTPPCVPLILKSKIKKVVISNFDPNKNVNGKGIKLLRDAGIEVITNILGKEGKELNKFYFKFVQEKLPFVTLKIALSIDGKISESRRRQTWLTGKESIKYVHKLRSEYDAVLVGAHTIKIDDPQLNVREVKGRNPIRIIIDGKDMAGNVWQWVGDPYYPIPEGYKILRGGRYGLIQDMAFRQPAEPNSERFVPFAGFRCAADQVKGE